MTTKDNNTNNKHWEACIQMELNASIVLSKQLFPFNEPIANLYEAGILAPTIPGKRHNEIDMRVAALFLKKSLNDLRAIWIAVNTGYTSQAASVAATLYENALAVICLAGDYKNTQKLLDSKDGDLPWKPQQQAQIVAKRWQLEEITMGNQFSDAEYEKSWRDVYAAYKWLCKIKHPTLRSALHDAYTTVQSSKEYVVMAAPDIREEDLPVKSALLMIAISRVREAIRFFVVALDSEKDDENYKTLEYRMEIVRATSIEAFDVCSQISLPFNLQGSTLANEWSNLKNTT